MSDETRPEPGDAIAASPYPNENGVVIGTSDAGRLLHYTADAHGRPMATYHSSTLNKPVMTPQAAISRLEEGEKTNESRHADLKIVPLRIGDTKHTGRSIIFHGGVAQGSVDPAKVGAQKIFTVSSGAMGPDRQFTERSKAIDAIHDHFVPETSDEPLEKETAKAMTLGDVLKSTDSGGHAHGADGKFTSSSGDTYYHKKSGSTTSVHDSDGKKVGHVESAAGQYAGSKHGSHHAGFVGKKNVATIHERNDGDRRFERARMEAVQNVADVHADNKKPKAKMTTLGDIFKEGTAHDPKTGRFTTGDYVKPKAQNFSGAGNLGTRVGQITQTKMINGRPLHEVTWADGADKDSTNTVRAKDWKHENSLDAATKKEHDARLPKPKAKMTTLGDIVKEGTAHDAKTGQFTSSSGASYSLKKNPSTKQHEVHSAKGRIGSVSASIPHDSPLYGKGGPDYVHRGHVDVSRADVKGPTTKGSGLAAGRLATAKIVADAHEASKAKPKGATKMTTADDLFKAGTAHDPATGQFTSSGGENYAVKTKKLSGGSFSTNKRHDLTHSDGRDVGHVNEHSVGKTKFMSHPKGVTSGSKAHATKKEAMQRLASIHESGNWSDEKKAAPWKGSSARNAVQMMHDMEHGRRKAMTIGDVFKSGGKTIGDIVKGDILAVPAPMGAGNYVGSFEETLRRIRGPVCAGSGCDFKPKYDESGNRIYEDSPSDGERKYPHYLDVVATFPDHAYVRCSDEDKTWKVPYSMDAENVKVDGEPELVVAQFVPASEATGEEVDADEDGDE